MGDQRQLNWELLDLSCLRTLHSLPLAIYIFYLFFNIFVPLENSSNLSKPGPLILLLFVFSANQNYSQMSHESRLRIIMVFLEKIKENFNTHVSSVKKV